VTPRLVLSKREAAHLLGVDRGRTLGELLRSGQLRAVPWGKGERIPLEEVQRLAREGFRAPGAKPRASHPRRKAKTDPVALRKLDLGDLAGRVS
jgi:excisionase family DNA binding protein